MVSSAEPASGLSCRIDDTAEEPAPRQSLFKIYTEMPQRLSPRTWRVLRWCSVATALALVLISFLKPTLGLRLFWGVYVPILPILFLSAPGIWRNICPMAALNQIPRTMGFTRGLTVPQGVQQYSPLISAGLFLLIVPFRRVALDTSGPGLAIFLLLVLGLAFTGGVFFKGKSGWCSQFCPMLQVERFYGQSPLRVIPNSHCRPCVGCNKNCYDFNPTAAYLADLHDGNPQLGTNRILFAGAMPWLIGAFFTQPDLAHLTLLGVLSVYGRILFAVAAGIGVFTLIEAVTTLSRQKIVLLHVVAALNVFYWFVAPLVLRPVGLWLAYAVEVVVAAVSLFWLQQAWPRERAFLKSGVQAPPRVSNNVLRVHNEGRADRVEVTFTPGTMVLAAIGETLLDIAEANKVPIESGCRMGMCGADPIRILSGGENLSPMSQAEKSTLERLGLGSGCRLACVCRAEGKVTVALDSAAAEEGAGHLETPSTAAPAFAINSDIRNVVVIGSGAAGMTAALEVRSLHPDATVTLIGEESYHYYNRMAIARLVAENTSIDKLYLMARDWAATKGVHYHRGVEAISINPTEKSVLTHTGETIPYDRLVLATGAQSAPPRIEGFGIEGSFLLRTIDDAVAIQQYIRRRRCRTAVVVGGGLLGLEVAHSIGQVGVQAIVLDRNEWPLSRQLDKAAGLLLGQMITDLGVRIIPGVETRRLIGTERLQAVELTNDHILEVDLCVAATGILPNLALARSAGLDVGRGIIVDEHMRTSDPSIYAAGDVAECGGRIGGLWPAAVEQAQIAVANLLGGDRTYEPTIPPTKLKVAAIDLLSVGAIAAQRADEREIVLDDSANRQYRKLVLAEDRLCGGILIGYSALADAVTQAVEERMDVSNVIADLERGEWAVLSR